MGLWKVARLVAVNPAVVKLRPLVANLVNDIVPLAPLMPIKSAFAVGAHSNAPAVKATAARSFLLISAPKKGSQTRKCAKKASRFLCQVSASLKISG